MSDPRLAPELYKYITLPFYIEEHKAAFIECLFKSRCMPYDVERLSMFYLLSLNRATRDHIEDIYDFDRNMIKNECFDDEWQTSSSLSMTYLAYDLFNNYSAHDDNVHHRTLLDIFSRIDYAQHDYIYTAVKIRFNRV